MDDLFSDPFEPDEAGGPDFPFDPDGAFFPSPFAPGLDSEDGEMDLALPPDELYDPDDPEGTWELEANLRDRLELLQICLSEHLLLEPDVLSGEHDDWEEREALLHDSIDELEALLSAMGG